MPLNTRFFAYRKPLTLADCAALIGGELERGNPEDLIAGVSTLEDATNQELVFASSKRFKEALQTTGAGLALVTKPLAGDVNKQSNVIVCSNPRVAFTVLAAALIQEMPPCDPGIHPKAFVDETANVHPEAQIMACAYVGPGVKVGVGSIVCPNATVDSNCIIGQDTVIQAGAHVSHAIVGDRCLIYPNACIGQRGFGFEPTPEAFYKVPQLGIVRIGDDVEIGSGTCIDRGALRDSVVGDGTMIDNMVQIGHGTQIGKRCIIVAHVSVAGSVTIHDFVMIGGHSAINGHIELATGSRIGPCTPVRVSTKPGEEVLMYPPMSARKALKRQEMITKLLEREGLI